MSAVMRLLVEFFVLTFAATWMAWFGAAALLHVTALSVAMAWLYWKTGGSLLLVMLMHASVNNTTSLVPSALAGATDPFAFSGSLVAWVATALSWIVAVPMLFVMRRADIGLLTPSQRPDLPCCWGDAMTQPGLTFARRVFTVSGIYGLLVLFPQYFMEGRIGRDYRLTAPAGAAARH